MDNITATPFGAAEHCALDNWAAEYAKKLFIAEAAKRTEEISAEAQTRAAADTEEAQARAAADTEEAQARAAADTEEAQARATADTEEAQARAAADTVLDNKKVNKDEYETALNALNEKINKIETLDIYSTTPRRIGTWIDGTPIWRVAFQQAFTEADIENMSFTIPVPVKIKEHAFVTDESCKIYYTSPSIVDDIAVAPSNYLICNISEKLSMKPTTADGFYGWIEFATPYSNMKNPYTDPDSAVDMGQGKDEGGEQIGDEASGENGQGNLAAAAASAGVHAPAGV